MEKRGNYAPCSVKQNGGSTWEQFAFSQAFAGNYCVILWGFRVKVTKKVLRSTREEDELQLKEHENTQKTTKTILKMELTQDVL